MARNIDLTAADIVAPAGGRVWEIPTTPEAVIHRGQDVVRMLDCGGVVVTAVISEAVYQGLQVGSPAHFQPRDGREYLPGTVISLSETWASPANIAI
jgi:hypothetical protein